MAKQKQNFNDIPIEGRRAIAENLKERVYSTITLIALLTAMWRSTEHRTTLGVIFGILGAVFALWLATIIADRMSYRAVHGKVITQRSFVREIYTTSGLLAPAIVPILLIAISGLTGWYSLETALLASMITSLLFLFGLSLRAGRQIYTSWTRLFIVSALEMSVGIGVIVLKLAVGE